jgi:hypothetical protein
MAGRIVAPLHPQVDPAYTQELPKTLTAHNIFSSVGSSKGPAR